MPKMPSAHNPEEHEPNRDLDEPIPAGVYDLEITDSEIEQSNAGDPMLAFTFTVLGPECEGRKLWHRLNLWHSSSERARKIAQGEMSAICRSAGYNKTVENSDVLHGKTVRARVKIETYTDSDTGETKKSNEIAAFKTGEDSGSGSKPWEDSGGDDSGEEDGGNAPPWMS